MTDGFAIDVENLGKTYRDGLILRRSFEALKGITLQVRYGEVFGLLGPNGAGKTTLVKLLLGIVRATRGRAMMLGRPAGDRAGRERVGYLPENLRIPRHHTALTALDLYGQMSGMTRSEMRQRSGPLLASVDLADRAQDSVEEVLEGHGAAIGAGDCLAARARTCVSGRAYRRTRSRGSCPGTADTRTTQGGRQDDLPQQPLAAGSRNGVRSRGDSGQGALEGAGPRGRVGSAPR